MDCKFCRTKAVMVAERGGPQSFDVDRIPWRQTWACPKCGAKRDIIPSRPAPSGGFYGGWNFDWKRPDPGDPTKLEPMLPLRP